MLWASPYFHVLDPNTNASEATFSEEFTPVIIIIAAVFWTKADQGLSVAEAFTSLTIISIASRPLVLILYSVMNTFGALGCFTRLQAFLELESWKDGRELLLASPKSSRSISTATPPLSKDIELSSIPHVEATPLDVDTSMTVLTIEDATFAVGDGVEVLKDVNMSIRQGSLSMIVGRVGSGKSSLLKAMAGEVLISKGRIILHNNSIGYCDQTTWLQNVTIRDNIVGQLPVDEDWFATVVRACALDVDCSLFPLGDRTVVGSGGVALSGGQKQRVVNFFL